jgi:hypothetical protein
MRETFRGNWECWFESSILETGGGVGNAHFCKHFCPFGHLNCRDRTGWLGRLDSNQGMAESKSAALPLGYAPMPRDACLQNRAGPHRIAAAIAPGNESLRGPAGLVPERRAKATGFSAQACPAAVSALRLFTGAISSVRREMPKVRL